MKAARVALAGPDLGSEALLIPGVGIAIQGRDAAQHVIVGQVALLTGMMPPMPLRETFDSLEEKFNGEPPKSKLL